MQTAKKSSLEQILKQIQAYKVDVRVELGRVGR